jgi:hypothetical protein
MKTTTTQFSDLINLEESELLELASLVFHADRTGKNSFQSLIGEVDELPEVWVNQVANSDRSTRFTLVREILDLIDNRTEQTDDSDDSDDDTIAHEFNSSEQ